MSIITVVGAGMMASALSYPLRKNGHTVRIVGTPLDREIIETLKESGWHRNLKRKLPDGITYSQIEDLEAAMEGAELIVGGVSSFGLDWFMEAVIPLLREDVPVLSVTKGMLDREDGTMLSYPEVYRDSTEKKISFNAIGGPCTSYELADQDQSHVTFCGWDMETLRWLKSLFETDYYHVSLSTDVRGVECSVALKNAYALAVSLAVGLSYAREGREFEHYNSQAALFGQSVSEMQKLLTLCGEKSSNIKLGAGDLYVTIFGGRTRKIGVLLGKGMDFKDAMSELSGVTLESIVITTRMTRAVKKLITTGLASEKDYPLLLHIDELINGGKKVDIPWDLFETETIL